MATWLENQRDKARREKLSRELTHQTFTTQSRMSMTPEQRLANYPVSQFDVAPQDQIVRYK